MAATLRNPLWAAGALVLAALIGAAAVRLSGMNITAPDAAAVVTRELRFEDRADGSIVVFDARSQKQVDTVHGVSRVAVNCASWEN